MRCKLYRQVTLIAFVLAGLLQFTGDVFIEYSIIINIAKGVLLAIGGVCGFMYFDSRPKRAESTGETKQ